MMNGIDKNIANFKTDIKLAVNRSLYIRGIITEEMYIKAKDMLIKTAVPNGFEKNSNGFFER